MGVKQGDELSPILFNLVNEEALRNMSKKQWGAKIGGNISVLAILDDIASTAEDKR